MILKIPWNNLKGAPLQIMINNLFVLAGPKTDTEYDEKKEEELEHKRKQELLETFEMLAVKPSSASPGNHITPTICLKARGFQERFFHRSVNYQNCR